MKEHELILVKHKDFITSVALLGASPQRGNDIVTEILNAYHLIDETIIDQSECATCDNIYRNSFKVILAYCESINWFQEEKKIKTK
jgi:hypothetical protein